MQYPHNENRRETTGVLLAGGESARMGVDKALIQVAGQTLISRSFNFLRNYFEYVIIAGDRPDMKGAGVQIVPDIYPGSALGGIYTGLLSAQTDWIFTAPCDMPHPDHRILELLLQKRHGMDAVVPKTPKGYEPVFALYHKNCLAIFEVALNQGRKSIFSLYPKLNVNFLEWQDMPQGWERSLMNINTPDELAELMEETK